MSNYLPGKFRFGPFQVDTHTGELKKGETRIRLVGQPFQILAVLLSRPGEVVTREELRSRLWPSDTFVDFDHGLNAAVNKLREALCDSADDPRYVETVPRRGYRFIAPVEPSVIPAKPARPAPAFVAERVLLRVDRPTLQKEDSAVRAPTILGGSPEGTKSRWSSPYSAAVGALIVVLLGAMLLWLDILPGERAPVSATLPQRITPLTGLTDATMEPAFSPNGNYVAFVRGGYKAAESGIFVKKIGGDSLVQLTRGTNDCCPAWSPDGKWIAFSHETKTAIGIFVVPATGGAERRLAIQGMTPRSHEVDWSPDGKAIVFGSGSIALFTLADSSVQRITEPMPESRDWGPSFSPDGQKILFVRQHEMEVPAEIMEVATDGRSLSVTITSERARIMGPPRWSVDGKSVIYSTDRGSPTLWRVSAESREAPVEITDGAWDPAISRRGYRFAYDRVTRNLSVWEMDASNPSEKRMLVPSTSPTDQGPGPQFSPDGTKLAYMSDRSGTMEIWVSDRDGSNAFQVTAVDGAGTPRWSPDSRSIAFDAHLGIFTVDLKGGPARPLVKDQFENVCPSWSRDGKWIFFASTRDGKKYDVWKVPGGGGAPVQVTWRGGHAGWPSLDGKFFYYAKTQYANPEIWQVPVNGGAEKLLSPLVRPVTWASWAVVNRGILFAGPSGSGSPGVSLFDFATRRVTPVGSLDRVPFWLGATIDGRSIVFDQPGWQQSQTMLVENFR